MTKKYDFPVSFTCRHEECDEQFKAMAIEQVLKLSKFHNRIEDGNITFDKKKNPLIRAEISLRIPGLVIAATHEDFNQVRALDEVVEKAKVQLQKIRSKVIDHRVVKPPTVPEELPIETEEEKEF
ncbi:MAG: HPF/RaiA family ribosome-associated protein [Candidatus Latescibacter sp.]|nr:HPF/RaiA family ribosome-associated protein [Candidatus Latescibacter sp.]